MKYEFRGKDFGGVWQEGSLMEFEDGACAILSPTGYNELTRNNVHPETVGQYTGLTDKNGKKIFEGDIVAFNRVNALGYTTSRKGEVRYYDKFPIFYIMATTGDAWDWFDCENIEVIGNIHDNPELLGVNEDA